MVVAALVVAGWAAVEQVGLAAVAILIEALECREMVLIAVEAVVSELGDELAQLGEEDLTSSSQHQKIQIHSV